MSILLGGGKSSNSVNESGKLLDLKAGTSSYGKEMVKIWGCFRVDTNLLWSAPAIEHKTTSTTNIGGKGGGSGSTITTINYSYTGNFAVMFGQGPNTWGIRKLWADQNLIYNLADDADANSLASTNALLASVTYYPGDQSQTEDPTISAFLGTRPAYRTRSYAVFANFDLTVRYGNRIPMLSAEICQTGSRVGGNQIARVKVTLAQIIGDICTLAGLSGGQYDTSLLTADLYGFQLKNGDYRSAIQQLFDAFQISARLSGTKIVFYPIDSASVVTIDISELGVSSQTSTGDLPELLPVARIDERELTKMVQVTYYDVNFDHQQGTQGAIRSFGGARNLDEYQWELVLDATTAQKMAQTLLWKKWIERVQYGPFTLGPKYLYLEPGDVIKVNDAVNGFTYEMRLTRVEHGANFSIQCEGVAHDSGIFTQTGSGAQSSAGVVTINILGTITPAFFNLPALIDVQGAQGEPGFYFGASASGFGFSGTLFWSLDGGANYTALADVPQFATMGTVAAATPVPAEVHIWDVVNVIQVVLLKGTLASVTDAQVLAGANTCVIGGEVLQFANAALVSGTTYNLSRLLRGRKGTEYATGSHGTAENFMLVDSGMIYIPHDVSRINTPAQFKIVPPAGEISLISPVAFTPTGENLRPYNPVQATGARDGSLNLTINWVRRGRLGQELPSGSDIALSEASEAYQVDVMNGVTVVRTISVTSPTASYTAAQQTTDFGSTQSSLVVKIYQISAVVGRGHVLTATV